MTNAEYYLKEGIDCGEFVTEFEKFALSKPEWEHLSKRGLLALFLEKQRKPILTEDERVILRNISKEYVKVGKNNEGLYFLSYRDCEPNTCYSYYASVFKSSLFSFIQEGDEYSIEELLKGE